MTTNEQIVVTDEVLAKATPGTFLAGLAASCRREWLDKLEHEFSTVAEGARHSEIFCVSAAFFASTCIEFKVPIEIGLAFIRQTHAGMVGAADPLKELTGDDKTSEQGGAK